MDEYQSIIKNDVWEIMSRPEGKFVVTSKWIYNIKRVVGGGIDKYKARIVARVFSHKEGEDYDESFTLVSRYTTIRYVISISYSKDCNLHKMDVNTAFLNGVIEEEVYIEQSQGVH